MFHCEFWCNDNEVHVRRLSALPPIGYELCADGQPKTVYVVEGGRIHLESGTMDIRTEVYVREKPSADAELEQMLEALAAKPWRSLGKERA